MARNLLRRWFHESGGKCLWTLEHLRTRRGFLKTGLLAMLSFIGSERLISKSFGFQGPSFGFRGPKRSLSFYNTHTGEELSAVYWESGDYLPRPLSDINIILRDYRTNEVISIDRNLLDLLHELRAKIKTQQPFHVISGYRSPKTNAFLCEQHRGVVKNSLHICGKAADIRLPGYELSYVRQVAMDLKGGGVGYYPKSDFIHVDVGRVRYW